jgi:hypothetical protein
MTKRLFAGKIALKALKIRGKLWKFLILWIKRAGLPGRPLSGMKPTGLGPGTAAPQFGSSGKKPASGRSSCRKDQPIRTPN